MLDFDRCTAKDVVPLLGQLHSLFAFVIGLVLVTHGNLALEFRSALEHVVGPQAQLELVAIQPDDNVDNRRHDILAAVSSVDTGDGVIVVTDMFGGTPSNLALTVLDSGRTEVLAGMNLPMLIKLAKIRADVPLSQAVMQAQDAGRKYIHVASSLLALS